jgi:hypothetical protein
VPGKVRFERINRNFRVISAGKGVNPRDGEGMDYFAVQSGVALLDFAMSTEEFLLVLDRKP